MASNEDGAKTKKDRAGDKKASKSDTKGGTKGTSNIQDAFLASAFRAAAESEAEAAVEHRKNVLAHVGPDVFSASDYEAADPDDWKHTRGRDNFTSAEVQIAKRCHGFHMELLKLDRTPIGSHYELIHYDVPVLGSDHIVKVTGCVSKPLELTVDDIKSRPQMTHPVFMACAGTGRSMLAKRFWTHAPWGPDCIGCSEWTGCSLADVLREAGPEEGAAQVIFTGADRGLEGGKVQYFQRSLTLEQCLKGHVMLVHGMNGNDLTPAHGFPVRIVVPGWYGMASVKWLTSIEVRRGNSWWGPQMDAYSFKRTADDPKAVPLEQLPVRALMVPPGFPDFVSRTRLVPPGHTLIEGKAWAGAVAIERVEFSDDNGASWKPTELDKKNGHFGWASWRIYWEAVEGTTTVLCCRAFDTKGRSQDPFDKQMFNYGSFGCTQPQQVYVKVTKLVEAAGASIDVTPEQKAAKVALQEESGLSSEHIQALYQAPGSQ